MYPYILDSLVEYLDESCILYPPGYYSSFVYVLLCQVNTGLPSNDEISETTEGFFVSLVSIITINIS